MTRVVVTGMGAVNTIGNNLTEYWSSLINGVSGAALITKFDATKFKTKFACEVKNFNPENIFEKNEIRKYDLFTQICPGFGARSDSECKRPL
jgi:3-oxoacyl-[acyl-carrier-protein] synthase II